ncbi:class I SAM-dependent methyltransferase [Larkinella insperata]|nr:class I SAM-dependent methyltransferase [Larkinella insperata]
MQQLGHSVVSIDPIYRFSAGEIATRIEQTYDTVISQLKANAEHYNWTDFRDADEVGIQRMEAMRQFLADYESGKQNGRYQTESLPETSFSDQSFDLALCSHLLFLYSAHLSEDFHLQAVRELLRLAAEVRIFPVIDLTNQPSAFVDTVLAECRQNGHQAELIKVAYHFQKNGDQMLCIRR